MLLGLGGDLESDWNEVLGPKTKSDDFYPKKPERFYRIEARGLLLLLLLPIELNEEKLSLWRNLVVDLDFSLGSNTPIVLSRRSFHF